MKIIESLHEMQQLSLQTRQSGRRIGFVPTMGALHDGHLSLLDIAKKHSEATVMSIFVNPTQFGPNEDFNKYPRDTDGDTAKARQKGCDVIFVPKADDIYQENYCTYVKVEKLTEGLCGASRPEHFQGVTTVVAKLFNIVLPHVAVFGQKDAQQLAVVKRMTRDLNFPIDIIAAPIVREADGLAMSSRNVYLSPEERKGAAVIFKALNKANEMVKKGVRDSAKICSAIRETISLSPFARIDYVSIVDADEMTELKDAGKSRALAAVAVYFGKTRLIDNILLGT